MKIALVHDYLKEYGGAELVLETLSDIFPKADIFTTLYCPEHFGPHRSRLEKKWSGRIYQSFFSFIPFASRLISPLRLLSPQAFRSFDFSGYDLIITSATGAYFPNALNKKSARLVCYCHTPPRYLYHLPTARVLTKNSLIYYLAEFVNFFLRYFDYKYSQNVDQYIANSHTTAARIWKFYRQKAVVINPPIDTPKITSIPTIVKHEVFNTQSSEGFIPEGREYCKTSCETYYLTGGRLARAKRYDIAIQACNQLKIPLKIFGRDFAGFESELRSLAGPTIEFVGEVTNDEKYRLMGGAKAYIFCSDNEDFGILPVEAMSQGCPVVAYGVGGATETIIDGRTGVLFKKLTSSSCASAIKKLNAIIRHSGLPRIRQSCLSRAKDFSRKIFIQKINQVLEITK